MFKGLLFFSLLASSASGFLALACVQSGGKTGNPPKGCDKSNYLLQGLELLEVVGVRAVPCRQTILEGLIEHTLQEKWLLCINSVYMFADLHSMNLL